MDRERLTALIDDPARVRRDDIADLKAMADRYPWFSAAHLLLAVGGHREGDVLFDEQLRVSAAHLPARSVLFDQLHHPLPLAPTPVAAPPVESAPPLEIPVLHIVPQDSRTEEPPTEPAPAEPLLAPLVGTAPSVSTEEAPVEAPVAEMAPPPSAQDEVPPEHLRTPWKERLLGIDRDEEELDRQMRDSAVAISYELLLEGEGQLDPAPEAPIAPTPAPPPVPVPAPPPPAAPRARSFSDWLGEDDPTPARPQPPASPQRSVTARPVTDPEIVRVVQQLPPITDPKHTPETPETKALVERFIQQNAQQAALPKKAEFFNPQTAAKRSLEEHADLVTETLARIYEKQGNIAKAIAAYERLAVKHPEKAAHFKALAKGLAGR